MKARAVKGGIHAALTLASLYEYTSAKTKARALLLGLCAGYHFQAAFYHWFIEEEE